MIEFEGFGFTESLKCLTHVHSLCIDNMNAGKSGDKLPQQLERATMMSIETLRLWAESAQMTVLAEMIEFRQHGMKQYGPITWGSLAADIDNFLKRSVDELRSHKFACVQPSRVSMFQNPNIFDEMVLKKFPDLADDVIDAGNCMAMGIHNSAVHEWLRIAEYGLRELAIYCRAAEYKTNVVYTRKQVEEETWKHLLDGIRRELDRFIRTRSEKRIRAVERADMAYGYVRSLYRHRNRSAHAGTAFSEKDAADVYLFTKSFMECTSGIITLRRNTRLPTQ